MIRKIGRTASTMLRRADPVWPEKKHEEEADPRFKEALKMAIGQDGKSAPSQQKNSPVFFDIFSEQAKASLNISDSAEPEPVRDIVIAAVQDGLSNNYLVVFRENREAIAGYKTNKEEVPLPESSISLLNTERIILEYVILEDHLKEKKEYIEEKGISAVKKIAKTLTEQIRKSRTADYVELKIHAENGDICVYTLGKQPYDKRDCRCVVNILEDKLTINYPDAEKITID